MDKEFLEDLGIGEDQIEKILAKYNGIMTEVENNHNTAMADIIKNNAISNALFKANAKTERAVKALLDMDKIVVDENGAVSGIDEQIERLMQSDDTSYLFEGKNIVGSSIGESPKEPEVNLDDMNYTQMCAYFENR